MPDKCDVCGHETSVLDRGTGEYAEKMVCGLCEDRNFREQLLRVEIAELKDERGSLKDDRTKLVLAAGKCVMLIDHAVVNGECNKIYAAIRNTLNAELDSLGIGL